MHFSLLSQAAALVLLSSPLVIAKTEDVTISLFPAIPEVTEIAANSSVIAVLKTTAAGSTNWGINAKLAKTTATRTATATTDTNFYVDVTLYPSQNSQVLNYYSGRFYDQVAEVTCSFAGTTSAVCQVTRLSEPTQTGAANPAQGTPNLTSSEVTYAPAQMTFVPVVFKDVPVSNANIRRVFTVPGLVVSAVAIAVMLL